MAPIKLGIIGYGFSTKCFHLPFILGNPDLDVHAFLQRAAAPEGKSQVKGWGHCTVDHPEAKHYRTADEFFADSEIELVIVCTHAHEEFIERALTAGKHVVVEKPFTNTSAAAEELIALAKEKGKILTVFQNRRWDSDFRTLRHLYENGAFGQVTEAEMHYDIPSPTWISGWGKEYSPGQGMMFGLGSHTIDQALVLFGRPSSVTAFLRSNRGMESDIDDTFTIILQYFGEQKNLLVTIKTTVVTHMKDQLKYFVRGTMGTFVKYGDDPQERRAIAAPGQACSTDESAGMEDESTWGTLTTTTEFDPKSQKYDSSCEKYIGKFPSIPGYYRGYYENVVAAIRGEAKTHVDPATARDGIRIMELARESHAKGATVPFA